MTRKAVGTMVRTKILSTVVVMRSMKNRQKKQTVVRFSQDNMRFIINK